MASQLDDLTMAQDAALVVNHCAGDASAFAELYARHYHRVLRTVRKRVHDDAVAEDLAQEAFAQAFAGLHKLRRPERFYPWLAAIARHMVARHHQLAARLCLFADVDTGRLSEAPESQLLRRLDEENLNTALERVRSRHRDILTMRETDGLSYEEIAARLGTPITTIPPLLFRARQALRREYLAVTAPRLALWPVIGSFIRRLRMRLVCCPGGANTAAATSSTVTTALLAAGVGALLFPAAASTPPATQSRPEITVEHAAATPLPPYGQGSTASHHPDHAGHMRTHEGRQDVTAVTRYTPDVTLDEGEMRRRREDARHMPYSFEMGPTWVGIDPDQMRQDVQSSLSGDHAWMEG